MTWLKSEDGVERCDIATTSGEVEEVAVTVRDEPALRLRFGKLLFV